MLILNIKVGSCKNRSPSEWSTVKNKLTACMGSSRCTDPLRAWWGVGLVKFFIHRAPRLVWFGSSPRWRWSNPADLAATQGCNVLLELLAMHELPWTKRRHPKHIGPPGCHCRRFEPQMSLFKHNPADPVSKRPKSQDWWVKRLNMLMFDFLCSHTGGNTRRLGWAVGWTGQIRFLCWKVCLVLLSD